MFACYIGIYAGIGAVGIIAVFIRDFIFSICGVLAGYRMHYRMFLRIIRAPMYFFDVSPLIMSLESLHILFYSR